MLLTHTNYLRRDELEEPVPLRHARELVADHLRHEIDARRVLSPAVGRGGESGRGP